MSCRAAQLQCGFDDVAAYPDALFAFIHRRAGTPQEFAKFFNESYEVWGKTVREAKITAEAK